MEKYKIGIIGAGHIAIKMANTLNAMQDAEAYGIAARDIAKAEAFAAAHNVAKAATRLWPTTPTSTSST